MATPFLRVEPLYRRISALEASNTAAAAALAKTKKELEVKIAAAEKAAAKAAAKAASVVVAATPVTPADVDLSGYALVDHTHPSEVPYSHNHDTLYYTEAEVDALIAGIPTAPTQHKIYSQPAELDSGSIVVYTGFAEDLAALPSEAKWAVKKQHQSTGETWAGKLTFNQILDDFLSLTYS